MDYSLKTTQLCNSTVTFIEYFRLSMHSPNIFWLETTFVGGIRFKYFDDGFKREALESTPSRMHSKARIFNTEPVIALFHLK